MKELYFDHQLCTFHLEKHLRKLVNDESNKIAKEYRAKLKKENPTYSKTKLNKMRDEKKRNLKKKWGNMWNHSWYLKNNKHGIKQKIMWK